MMLWQCVHHRRMTRSDDELPKPALVNRCHKFARISIQLAESCFDGDLPD